MLDAGHAVALLSAGLAAFRARSAALLVVLACALGLFALECAGGLAARGTSAIDVSHAALLIFVGLTALPAGDLGGVPLVSTVAAWPLTVRLTTAVVMAVAALLVERGARALAEASDAFVAKNRLELSLIFLGVVEVLAVVPRVLPRLLGGDAAP